MNPVAEFKFACPVCHQHIMAAVASAGAEIECPTCFRHIVVPKSPGGATTKLILRGTQAGKVQTRFEPSAGTSAPAHTSIPKLAAVVTLIVTMVVLAASSFAKYNDRLQKTAGQPPATVSIATTATR